MSTHSWTPTTAPSQLKAKARRRLADIYLIQNRNKIDTYGPWTCLYAVLMFVAWCVFWGLFTSDAHLSSWYSKIREHIVTLDAARLASGQDPQAPGLVFDDTAFRKFSFATAGCFFSAFVSQALQLRDIEDNAFTIKSFYAILATGTVNFISFFSHLCMALGWFPLVLSPFGRVMHIVRWGEWVSLVPLLMIMMYSVCINDDADLRLMWISTTMQQLSVLTGGVSSLWRGNWNLAVVMMVLSFITYFHIFYCVRKRLVDSKADKLEKQIADKNKRVQGTVGDSNPVIIKLKELADTMATQLTVYCAISWTLIVAVYTLGMFDLVDATTECMLQSVMDVVAKLLYALALCQSHGTTVNYETYMASMLHAEEQQVASMKQFIKFLHFELASDVHVTMIGIHSLSAEIQDDPQVTRFMTDLIAAGDKCLSIVDEVLATQDPKNRSIHANPDIIGSTTAINLKNLVKETVGAYITMSNQKHQTMIVSMDPRIPDVLFGVKAHCRYVLSIMTQFVILISKESGVCSVTCEMLYRSQEESKHLCETQQIKSLKSLKPMQFFKKDETVFRFIFGYDPVSPTLTPEDVLAAITGPRPCKADVFVNPRMRNSLNFANRMTEVYGGRISCADQGSLLFVELALSLPHEMSGPSGSNSLMAATVLNPVCESNIALKDVVEVLTSPRKIHSPSPRKGNCTESNILKPAVSSIKTSNISYERPDLFSGKIRPASSNGRPSFGSKTVVTNSAKPLKLLPIPAFEEMKMRALVVDDDKCNQKLLKLFLGRCGVDVEIVSSGKQMVDKVIPVPKLGATNPYDIIILDDYMSEMTGTEGVKVLRKHNYQGLIVGLTSMSMEEDLEAFQQAGCNMVFVKPLNIAEFSKALKSYNLPWKL